MWLTDIIPFPLAWRPWQSSRDKTDTLHPVNTLFHGCFFLSSFSADLLPKSVESVFIFQEASEGEQNMAATTFDAIVVEQWTIIDVSGKVLSFCSSVTGCVLSATSRGETEGICASLCHAMLLVWKSMFFFLNMTLMLEDTVPHMVLYLPHVMILIQWYGLLLTLYTVDARCVGQWMSVLCVWLPVTHLFFLGFFYVIKC